LSPSRLCPPRALASLATRRSSDRVTDLAPRVQHVCAIADLERASVEVDGLLVAPGPAVLSGPVDPGAGGQVESAQQIDPAQLKVDRKSTRLNSSHVSISYAVFCWK